MMSSLAITHLPSDVFRCIQDFSSKDDYHYFVNSNKQYFASLKKATLYLSLCETTSSVYIRDERFRAKVLKVVENGWKQISLRFWDFPESFPSNVPAHALRRSKGFSTHETRTTTALNGPLSYIECIEASLAAIRDLPVIPLVKELVLYNASNLIDTSKLSHLSKLLLQKVSHKTDMHSLRNIPHITFLHCLCDTLPDFSKLQIPERSKRGLKIKISIILSLTPFDLAAFRGIHRLELRSCNSIIDVSPLYGVYDLKIHSCNAVQDISGLGGHHRLDFFAATKEIIGYESLFQIPHVVLSNAGKNFTDVSVLRYAKSVKLVDCQYIQDISPIKHVKSIHIENCPSIINLSELKDVPRLSFQNMQLSSEDSLRITTFSFPFSCQFSFPDNKFTLANIQSLVIDSRPTLVYLLLEGKIILFQQLSSLTIRNCHAFTHVHGFGSIPNLILQYCYELSDISGLGSNRYVKLEGCQQIEDVSSLATVPMVTIKNCEGIKNRNSLSKVPRLKFINVKPAAYFA